MRLKYQVDEKPRHWETAVYGLQWTAMILSSNIFLLLLVAGNMGFPLDMAARFVQRSLMFIGLSCLLQIYLGHRLTIFDVVASFWLSTFIFVGQTQQSLGISLNVALGKLQFLQIVTGLFMILLTASGLAGRLKRFFTPMVMGVTLILISIQMSAAMLPGMMSTPEQTADMRLVLFSTVLFLVTLTIGFRGGRFQPFVGLIGLGGGWLTYTLLRLPAAAPSAMPGFLIPEPFAFGPPVADWSLVPIALFIVMIYLSNEIASVNAGGDVMKVTVTDQTIRRTSYVAGASHMLAALFSSITLVPAAMGAGLVATTGVGARRPMAVGATILIGLGLIGPVGSFFAAIPPAVSYSVSLSIVARIMYMGLKNCFVGGLDERTLSIAGVSILVGSGIMFLPTSFFATYGYLSSILGNGLFIGVLMALFLENVLFRSRFVLPEEPPQ